MEDDKKGIILVILDTNEEEDKEDVIEGGRNGRSWIQVCNNNVIPIAFNDDKDKSGNEIDEDDTTGDVGG